jgi:IS5 family transposase
MRNSDKAFIQAYNAQAAVDSEHQIIVAADASNQAADSPHLLAITEQVEKNTGRQLREVSADAGYFSEDNMKALMERGIEVLIPPKRIRHSEWREMKSPRGRPPRSLDLRGRMWRKLHTKRARQRYKLRQQTVEPVFGQIKWNRGLQQWLLRGLAATRASWRFECAVHNLLKMRTAGVLWA